MNERTGLAAEVPMARGYSEDCRKVLVIGECEACWSCPDAVNPPCPEWRRRIEAAKEAT
jgi:hypothetical protein